MAGYYNSTSAVALKNYHVRVGANRLPYQYYRYICQTSAANADGRHGLRSFEVYGDCTEQDGPRISLVVVALGQASSSMTQTIDSKLTVLNETGMGSGQHTLSLGLAYQILPTKYNHNPPRAVTYTNSGAQACVPICFEIM